MDRSYNLGGSLSVVGVLLVSLSWLSCNEDPFGIDRRLLHRGSLSGSSSGPTTVAFFSCRDGDCGFFIMEGDGSNEIRLTSQKDVSVDSARIDLSPDGARVAFGCSTGSSSGLCVMKTDGSDLTHLTPSTPRIDERMPSWSPDGTKIAYVMKDLDFGDEKIAIMNADGSNQTVIVDLQPTDRPGKNQWPDWSPDGTKIVFSSNHRGDRFCCGRDEIFVVDASGLNSNLTQITDRNTPRRGNDLQPGWSSNGQIVFVSGRDGTPDIFTMNADGSNQVNLTNSSEIENDPSWSPDGMKIIFKRGLQFDPSGSSFEIYTMEANGSNTTPLTNNAVPDFAPNWSVASDTDGDSWADYIDNCPDFANTTQLDYDGDGIGDACDLDRDGDDIENDVDTDPDSYSSLFSDISLGGSTTGEIVARGDQALLIRFSGYPEVGIRVSTTGSTGSAEAMMRACGGSIESSFSHPADFDVLCGSVIVAVNEAPPHGIQCAFIADDGRKARVSLAETFRLKFDSEMFVFEAPVENPGPVIIQIGGGGVSLSPGASTHLALIDIKPGSDPNCFNNDGQGVIPVAVLGSADFDVSLVDPTTIRLEGLAVRAVGNANRLQTHIQDVNGDGYHDLVVQIEDTDGTFTSGSGTATLIGQLANGTEIEGSDSICVVP